MLRRLDDLAAHLATRGDALALLGLGSAGVEHDRFDEHSDLDFFVVVEDAAKSRYLESIDWLQQPCPVAYSFANDRNGRKALFADGIFAEYAIFTSGSSLHAPDVLPLAEMVPGYEHSREAATVTLNWLEKRFAVDPVIAAAIRTLLPDPR
ncbi:hypothetical protein [Nonomuraea roseoviolacea]|uniref:Nucleotidyltransferase domain-containing protein n=1 Tax=Nonomuraea roseoviolacea subsp. carminata TaxID=160689 RepID=A0ABT1KG78_9ACTN|nr:hypothetical protein [Nonomuraea roseoviolacea]MCP2352386.1 hypothetical protein [Nonomuraea roseoviolacea subsp. carminata]